MLIIVGYKGHQSLEVCHEPPAHTQAFQPLCVGSSVPHTPGSTKVVRAPQFLQGVIDSWDNYWNSTPIRQTGKVYIWRYFCGILNVVGVSSFTP